MQIIRTKDYDELSRKAANYLSAQVLLKPKSVLGLATGSTPLGTYQHLIKKYEDGDLDFSETISVNLDEYKGLSPVNTQSYRYFMNENLFSNINIKIENTYVPNGLEEDEETECARYEAHIRALGGIDMQLLGLGFNGHIGFNEPSKTFMRDTHCVELADSTIHSNKRFFGKEEDVPRKAYTMGIGTIMRARRILLVVSGEGKAEIVRKAFTGSVTPEVPASVLQLHNHVILLGDQAALSLL